MHLSRPRESKQLDLVRLLERGPEDAQSTKMAWKLFRQFQELDSCCREFQLANEPHVAWHIDGRVGTVEDRAIKLSLRGRQPQETSLRCETVALFPGTHSTDLGSPKSAALPPASKRWPRATACVSTQPGCGVRCPFCSTGELGYRGSLSASQIVEQVYWVGLVAKEYRFRLRNVVFMGMGEPLHNLSAVSQAVRMLTDSKLFGLQPRHITISTVGVPAAMIQLATEFPSLRLALSLHSAIAAQRRQLVPRAVGDLEQLREVIAELNQLQSGQTVWLEVVLFDAINDSMEHAAAIVEFARGLNVEVNLIPYNPAAAASTFRPSNKLQRERFAENLRQAGIRTSIRSSFGSQQNAACGQLKPS
ncbi:MAG: radical SAM protein [bacterium]|nr:radical SAM protein [bacterium]